MIFHAFWKRQASYRFAELEDLAGKCNQIFWRVLPALSARHAGNKIATLRGRGVASRKNCPLLLELGEPQRQARLLAVGRGAVDHAGLHGLVEGGDGLAQRGGGLILLARVEGGDVALLKCFEAAFHAAIAQLFAGAVAHPAFG